MKRHLGAMLVVGILIEAGCASDAIETAATPAVFSEPADPPLVEILSTTTNCGPAGGMWVWLELATTDDRTVVAEVWLDGQAYGRSERHTLSRGVLSRVGLAPGTPDGEYGRVAEVKVVGADRPTDVLDESQVRLELPDDFSCM